jgi:hypothetical protein
MRDPSLTINKVKINDHGITRGVSREMAYQHIKESEIVRKRYHTGVRTLVSDLITITREEAADMISRSKRQLQQVVKRFREEGITHLSFRSKRPHNSPNNS